MYPRDQSESGCTLLLVAKIDSNHSVSSTTSLQNHINKDWSNKWLMRLNLSKYKLMHIGKKNAKRNLHNVRSQLKREFGIFIFNNHKPSHQVSKTAANPKFKLSSLKNAFTLRNDKLWKKAARMLY